MLTRSASTVQTVETARHTTSPARRTIQRIASDESPREEDAVVMADEERFADVQRKPTDSGYFAPRYASADVSRRIGERTGSGEQLDRRVRTELSPWFAGHLDSVRVHRDMEANFLAERVAARAFTTGRDIYFASGEYQPESIEGRRVLAHELAHVAQQVEAGTGVSVQRLSAPRRQTRTDVHPWGNEISGDDYEVETDNGTPISAWIAYSPWKTEYQYWCHGHSLGTFASHGYSVYSGDPIMETVNQEWSSVSSGSERSGDIAVWLPNYEHSCRVETPAFANGQLDPTSTIVSSKNGGNPLVTTMLTNIMLSYPGGSPAFYRRR